MYSAQLTVSKIQSALNKNGFTQKQMLSDCGLNPNILNQMTDNKGMSSFYLAKIADYLNVSVDYLLGRVDIPQIESSDDAEILNMIQQLSLTDKAEIILILKERIEKGKG